VIRLEPDDAGEIRTAVRSGLNEFNFSRSPNTDVFGVQEDYPPGYRRFYFQKELKAETIGTSSGHRKEV
jgi:hypothetical protein